MIKNNTNFYSNEDYEFICNLEPRPGEPVHSDLWSQIYDYLLKNHKELNYDERSNYLNLLLKYKENLLN